ncbi:MAG: hypothetical protein WBF67_00510 [Olleya sp.]
MSVLFLDLFQSRIVRVVSICLYLVLYLFNAQKVKKVILLFLLLCLSDYFDVYYNIPEYVKAYTVTKIFAYVVLFWLIKNKIKLFGKDIKINFLFGLIVVLNLVIGYGAVYNYSSGIVDNIEFCLLLIYGLVIVLLAVFSANYYFRYNSKRGLYFMSFIFGLVFADMSGFFANYVNMDEFFYVERAFYFSALLYFTFYLFLTKEEDDVLIFGDEEVFN